MSPPRTITLVHAVQRPLVDQCGRLSARRQMGHTHAILGTRELNIDVPSTGRIDIRATWTDMDDTAGLPPTSKRVVATVGSYNVEHRPLYEALPPIRQEFTDTRRRRVTYTVTAVSRFHEYFGSITATNPDACTVKGVLGVTDVPSSARPPAPTLRYLMPTSRWSREGTGTSMIRSSRRGGGVRAFVERPWFVSGDDEALAVLASPQSTSIPPAVLRRVSVAGRDPVWDTGNPATVLNPGHFNAEFWPEFLAESAATVSALSFGEDPGPIGGRDSGLILRGLPRKVDPRQVGVITVEATQAHTRTDITHQFRCNDTIEAHTKLSLEISPPRVGPGGPSPPLSEFFCREGCGCDDFVGSSTTSVCERDICRHVRSKHMPI